MPLPPVGTQAARVLGYQQVAAGGADASFAPTIPDGTEYIEVVASAQAIRWRADGVAPSATVGMPVAVGVATIFFFQSLPQLRLIAQVAGAALDITYYGR